MPTVASPGVAFAASLGLRLRRAGVAVGLMSMESLSRALAQRPPASARDLYYVARVTLVKRGDDIACFEEVFWDLVGAPGPAIALRPEARVFAGPDDAYAPAPGPAAAAEAGQGLPWIAMPRGRSERGDSEREGVRLPERLPSNLEALADVPFEALDDDGLALLERWLRGAWERWPTRRSRRMKRHHAGRRITLRPTLSKARRTGFEPVELVRNSHSRVARPVVMLCDVSQSMQYQATAYFHLMRAMAKATDAEVFAFATHLTRLTPVLRQRSAPEAIEQATAKVSDRFGGTRIATNLQALLSSSRGNACRGAVVLIASDGWDSDPPEQLRKAMARLRRRAHSVIWMNPRAGAARFAPEVGAMSAALPFLDRLLPADTIRSLGQVVETIVELR